MNPDMRYFNFFSAPTCTMLHIFSQLMSGDMLLYYIYVIAGSTSQIHVTILMPTKNRDASNSAKYYLVEIYNIVLTNQATRTIHSTNVFNI